MEKRHYGVDENDTSEHFGFNDIYGQTDILQRLETIIKRCSSNKVKMPNILLVGPDRDQAINLAKATAGELNAKYSIVSAIVSKSGEMSAILNSQQDDSVLFIDIDILFPEPLSLLEQALMNRAIQVEIGKGENARSITLTLPSLVYFLYTQDERKISTHLTALIPEILYMQPLSYEERQKAVIKYCNVHEISITDSCSCQLAEQITSWASLEKFLKYLIENVVGRKGTITQDVIEDTKEYAKRINCVQESSANYELDRYENLITEDIGEKTKDFYLNLFFIALDRGRNIWQIAEKVKNRIQKYIDEQDAPLSLGFDGLLFAYAIANELGVSPFEVIKMTEETRNDIIINILNNSNNKKMLRRDEHLPKTGEEKVFFYLPVWVKGEDSVANNEYVVFRLCREVDENSGEFLYSIDVQYCNERNYVDSYYLDRSRLWSGYGGLIGDYIEKVIEDLLPILWVYESKDFVSNNSSYDRTL